MIKELGVEVTTPKHNTIIGNADLSKSVVTFKGTGNILYIEDPAEFKKCKINFAGDNAVAYISSNVKYQYQFSLTMWSGTAVYLGKDTNYRAVDINVAERQNVIVGRECLFSTGVCIRTSDVHIIYDATTHKRINMSKSIVIGDHCWVGQNAMVLKGCVMGSGSILGAGAVAANKIIPSNTIFSGNPARMIKDNIFFTRKSSNDMTEELSKEHEVFERNMFIYEHKTEAFAEEICKALSETSNPKRKLRIIVKRLASDTHKNRLAV